MRNLRKRKPLIKTKGKKGEKTAYVKQGNAMVDSKVHVRLYTKNNQKMQTEYKQIVLRTSELRGKK